MLESRDRLIRENSLDSFLGRPAIWGFRPNSSENERGSIYSPSPFTGVVGGELNVIRSPLPMRLRPRTMMMSNGSPVMMPSLPGLMMGTPFRGYGGALNRYGSPNVGQENVSRLATARRRGSLRVRTTPLPVWYPRTPLRDITAVVNAVERQRTSHQLASHSSQESSVSDPSAPLKHDTSITSPSPRTARKGTPLPVLSKILLDIQDDKDSFVTPQKKLLNSLEQVEKVVMEEIRMMKRTPSAKRAEKERKVRTLMTMR